jgi:hypothetical protein
LLADHYIDDRLSLAGWDLSSQIQAAIAVGQDDYAEAIALQIILRRAAWENIPYGGYDYTLISRATLVGALADLEGKTIKKYRDEARTLTLAAQDVDGAWDADYQTTAFALSSLAESPHTADVKKDAAGAIKYLLSTESPDGGWIYVGDGEYGEVNGEVLSALTDFVRRHGDGDRDERGFKEPGRGHHPQREPARRHHGGGDR